MYGVYAGDCLEHKIEQRIEEARGKVEWRGKRLMLHTAHLRYLHPYALVHVYMLSIQMEARHHFWLGGSVLVPGRTSVPMHDERRTRPAALDPSG
jgi:hypothetical protein